MKIDFVEDFCVIGIVFSLVLTLTGVFPDLTPGSFVRGIWGCIVNGLVYGIIFSLIYIIVVPSSKSKPEPIVRYKPEPIPEPEVSTKIHVPKAVVPVIDVEGIGEIYAKKLTILESLRQPIYLMRGELGLVGKNSVKKQRFLRNLFLSGLTFQTS